MLSFRTNSMLPSLGLFILLLAGCQPSEEQTVAPIIRPVITQRIEIASNQESSFPATTEATERASLGFRVRGQIQTIDVHPGQTVKAGQLLAQLDSTQYQLHLDTAKAQAKLAQLEYARGQQLLKDRTISQASFDQLKADLAVTKSELNRAEQNLQDTNLVAPFDGIISFKHHNVYETVKANKPILNLQAKGLIDVTLSIAESRLRNLGEVHQITASVRFDSYPDKSYPAVFKSLDSEVNTDTGSYKLHLTLNTPETFLALPGMTALVTLKTLKSEEETVTLPATALIQNSATGTQVWVVEPKTMQVHLHVVNLDSHLQVISGLNDGDLVVLRGVHSLEEGQIVQLWQRERGI